MASGVHCDLDSTVDAVERSGVSQEVLNANFVRDLGRDVLNLRQVLG
jgi:hypothetical protein